MSYSYYNPNPTGKSVGDCPVRALSRALGQSWDETYAGLALKGFCLGDMPNADSVWGPYLRDHGFTRYLIPDECPDCYTVAPVGHSFFPCLGGMCCASRTANGLIPGTVAERSPFTTGQRSVELWDSITTFQTPGSREVGFPRLSRTVWLSFVRIKCSSP